MRLIHPVAALSVLALVHSTGVLAGDPPAPRVLYTKSFPGSTPAFVSITVERDGRAIYKEAPDDDNPLRFRLSDADTAALFDLVAKLGGFTRPLESGLKVAQMGLKTFRYEAGGTAHQVSFNYSTDLDARTLADGFEKIVETERDFVKLDGAVHFDSLGVNDALLDLETTYDHKRLVAPGQFLALLDRVAKNDSFLHMARERAAKLADLFRNPPPPKSEEKEKPAAEKTGR